MKAAQSAYKPRPFSGTIGPFDEKAPALQRGGQISTQKEWTMSKRWMGFALLLVLVSGPAVHAADAAPSGSIFQAIRQILDQISAMIPPTGHEDDQPPVGP